MFTSTNSRENYEELWRTYFVSEHLSEAPRFDLLGYDLMQALVAWLRGEQEFVGLQSAIRWTQTDNAGWQNESIQIVEK